MGEIDRLPEEPEQGKLGESMSDDDRLYEIKRFLDTTIEEFESLFQSAGGFEDSRIGNGWDPARVKETVYLIKPIPLDKAIQIAESRKRQLFAKTFVNILKPRSDEIEMIGRPVLQYIPYWGIRGFHECFFFRGNAYKVDVPSDVVAVEVDGEVRNLLANGADRKSILAGLRRSIASLNEPKNKYFTIDKVTELAYRHTDGEIFLDGDGNEDSEIAVFLKRGQPMLKIQNLSELELPGTDTKIMRPVETKENVIKKLYQKIVNPPASFNKILSNKFEITQVGLYFLPFYVIAFRHRDRVKELRIHGSRGEVID